MNHVYIIGNLTADPKTATTAAGKQVTNFTVAVNRRQSAQTGQPEADFFRVSAWNQLGEICAKYLSKGRKCAVTGSIRAGAYTNSQGQAVGTLELLAEEVEFLSPRQETAVPPSPSPAAARDVGHGGQQPNYQQPSMISDKSGFVQVDDEELPF